MNIQMRGVNETGLVRSKFTKKYWIENSKGERITDKFYIDDIYTVKEGDFIKLKTSIGDIIYHKSGTIIKSPLSDRSYVNKIAENLYRITCYDRRYNCKTGLYKGDGTLLTSKFSEIEGLRNGRIAVKLDDKYGFIDETGKIVITPAWERVTNFNDQGYSIVTFKDARRISVIDKNGCTILAPVEYSRAEFIDENLLCVTKDKLSGIIDLSGKVIIPAQYDNIYKKENHYIVYLNNKYGLFDLQGNVVFECIYPEIIETPDKFVVADFARKEELKTKEATK